MPFFIDFIKGSVLFFVHFLVSSYHLLYL